jgi:hypothetical protein
MNIGLPCLIFCFDLDGPDMEGRSRPFPMTLCPYCRTLACVIKSSESSSDFPPFNMSSHLQNLRRWTDGLGFSRFGLDGTQMG